MPERVLVAAALPVSLAEALPTVAEIETGISLPDDDPYDLPRRSITVDGGENPRKSGAGPKAGTRFAVDLFVAKRQGGKPLSTPSAAEGGGRSPVRGGSQQEVGDGGDSDGRCATADNGWPHSRTVSIHRTGVGSGHPAPTVEDQPACPVASQGARG
jgi:hypothetical protein